MKTDEKGRQAKGDRNGARLHPEKVARGARINTAKLVEEEVRAIRRMATETTKTQTEIAQIFGVTQAHISGILRNKTWRHL